MLARSVGRLVVCGFGGGGEWVVSERGHDEQQQIMHKEKFFNSVFFFWDLNAMLVCI